MSRVVNKKDIVYTDLVQEVSNSLGMQRSSIVDFFARPKQGEIFLLSQDFNKIKRDLQLPTELSALQVSQMIVDNLNQNQ
jgi:hypothetical protein